MTSCKAPAKSSMSSRWRSYRQLMLRRRSCDAFSDSEVVRRLNLTDPQVRDIRALSDRWRTQMADLERTAAANRRRALRQYNQQFTQYMDRLNGILNEQQQRTWTAMIGNGSNFQPDFARNPSVNNPPR